MKRLSIALVERAAEGAGFESRRRKSGNVGMIDVLDDDGQQVAYYHPKWGMVRVADWQGSEGVLISAKIYSALAAEINA